jgi:hypothetical protein
LKHNRFSSNDKAWLAKNELPPVASIVTFNASDPMNDCPQHQNSYAINLGRFNLPNTPQFCSPYFDG